ncbi:MAG: cation-translocating P-type ATPase, partial [Clostridia bacterium]
SSVVYGRGRAVVVATGMDTEMGKIANVISNTMDDATPLQKKLNGLSKILTYLVIGICVFIFVFTLIKTGDFGAASIINTFMIAISLAVAAIPEGLATVVTIVLSIGVTKMSKRNAVVRKLTAVEALGCTQVICSDKTGTLTQNKMTVVDSYTTDKCLLAKSMALCSDSELDENNDATGEPTENALVNFAYKENLPKPELKKQEPRVSEAPFDSMRKMMSTLHQKDVIVVQYTKGAPDELLKVCSFALEKGKIVPLTDKIKQEILAQNKHMADKALRVLASAYKEYPTIPTDVSPEKIEKDLIFIGLVGMIDPIRPEVKDAIALCRTAGIRPVMITGDHRDTAIAIAKELGIIENAEQAITGAELDTISDEQLALDIEKYAVYARVQPEHKVRIVNAWKKENKITAMTGDGVNDAPSIKSADIGIGMGITGTDVTKNVADMILADDNFATIVTAVEEGRKIYDNIRKAIQFLLSSNLSEVFAIFFASIVGFTILKPVHILWINLITDSLPAIALGLEKGDSDIMERAPRSSKDGIFAGGLGIDVVYQGFLVAALTVCAYIVGNVIEHGRWTFEQSNDGITMAFLALSMSEIFHSFNMRSQRHSIITKKDHNKYLYGAMLLALLLTTTIVYVPFLAKVFEFTAISATEYFIAMAISFSIIPIVEIVKLFQRLFNKNRMKKLNKSNI